MSRGDGAGHKFARVALLLVLLSLIAAPGHGRRLPTPRDEERLIGWQGETHDSRVKGSGASLSDDAQSDLERGYWAEPVSWYPRAFHLHNVMSGEECDQFLAIAEPKVRRSTVIDSVTGESKVDPIRTSEQTFLNRGVFDVVTEIEERLARITMLPSYHGEDMQVLRYHIGEKYDAHHDVGELSSKSGAASTRPSERVTKRKRRAGSSSSMTIASSIAIGKMPGAVHSQCGSSLIIALTNRNDERRKTTRRRVESTSAETGERAESWSRSNMKR